MLQITFAKLFLSYFESSFTDFVPKGQIASRPILFQVPNRRPAIIWSIDNLAYLHTYVPLGIDKLKRIA